MLLVLIPILLLLIVFAYSYVWTDMAIILLLAKKIPWISNINLYKDLFGQYKSVFATLFIIIVAIFAVLQIVLLLSKKKFEIKRFIFIAIPVFIAALSYPFLSNDIFSYLFAGRMVVIHGLNPYTVIPETLRNVDFWIWFTQWTHRTYAYGPVSLLYSIIPILAAFGKVFPIAFYGMKLINAALFLLAGRLLLKNSDRKSEVLAFWFFNPLLIFELLINSHNDVVMISIFVISYVLIKQGKKIWSWVLFTASVLVKYVSIVFLPVFILNEKYRALFFKIITLIILAYLGVKFPTIQAWYYTWIYMAVPFAKFSKFSLVSIFIFQIFLILVKYYPFILTGSWNQIPMQPYVEVLAITLPILIIVIEYKNIMKFLTELKVSKVPVGERLKEVLSEPSDK